jgi:hypothetical protein
VDKNQALSNLEYLKTLAESGERSPLLGGRIGLMWAGLLVPTLIAHGLVMTNIIDMPRQNIGFLWLCFGIVGGVLSMILSRGLGRKSGAGTAANQVAGTIWPFSSILIFGFAISIAVGHVFGQLPQIAFSFILPFAFATSAMSQAVLARMTGETYLGMASWLGFVFVCLTAIFANRGEVYFLAALGVLLTGVLPSLVELRKEAVGG